MKKILIFLLLTYNILSSQPVTCVYDSLTGNHIISINQDTVVEKLIFYPKTKVIPSVTAKVNIINDTLLYNYRITNSNLSEDYLAEFYIPKTNSITKIGIPNTDWLFGENSNLNLFHWSNIKLNFIPPGDIYAEVGMPPGFSQDGFYYQDIGLPSIIYCYFQGHVGVIGCDNELPEEVEDILRTLEGFPLNYVKRSTIGPKQLPNPFIHLNFIDTLVSYTTQSKTLGWIKEQTIADKYLGFFASTKTKLTASDSSGARTVLENVLSETVKDSTNAITSEAFALLYYNTEYLVNKLPKQVVIPVADMLDSLRIRLQQSNTNKWIGNQQWVNELDKHLQNAKKQYAKGEKQSPIEQLEVFCKQIKNEYESKNKNRWITKEGFEYLYPYAQNIIERMK